LTTALGGLYRAMRGTERKPPRCCALQGEIGRQVHCTVYSLRPSTCREFQVSGEQGVSNPGCDRARRQWDLPPLDIPPGIAPLELVPDLPVEEPPRAA
jgi:Fe-S-cluster containining protein